MSKAAVYHLSVSDQRFDQAITASGFLAQRLADVRAARTLAGREDPTPGFADIERTHKNFLYASYRPHVAVASEYARIKSSGGSTRLGAAGTTLQFTLPVYGEFTSDIALRVRFPAIGSTTATTATASTPLLRYCALPGVRLLSRVELRSDQTLVDDYTPDDVIASSKFFLGDDQRLGWERCMGQQEQREAIFIANGYTSSLSYRDGAQTPKLAHDSLELMIPLQFGFCRDTAAALFNELIPNSQRVITCELAALDKIVAAFTSDVMIGGTLAPTALPFASLQLEAELYVNNLYTNPEITEVFQRHVGFSLIRVHRRQVAQVQSASDMVLLSQLKFPTEYLMVGCRARANAADFDRWHLMGAPGVRDSNSKLYMPVIRWNNALSGGVGGTEVVVREAKEVATLECQVASLGITAHSIPLYDMMPAAFYNAYLPMRYPQSRERLTVTPHDTSAFLINFCLYPGANQPSGYFNLSGDREMYLKYDIKPSAAEAASNGGSEFVISSSAINFLMRGKGDKIMLRYAL